jgi:hypothetical protein
MQKFRERIRELASSGEDVSALERASNKGLAETRQAFADFDKQLVNRDRMETWRGIKTRLLSAPPAATEEAGARNGAEPAEGPTGRPGNAGRPAEDGAGAANAAKKKIRKLKK